MLPDEDGATAAAEAHATDDIPVETSNAHDASKPAAPEPEVEAVATDDNGGDDGGKEEAGHDAPSGKPPKLPEWAQKQLNNLAAEKRIAEREAKRLADELAAAKAPKTEPAVPDAADEAAARDNAPAGGYRTQADFDRAVQETADRKAAEDRQRQAEQAFNARSNEIYTAGKTNFGDEFDTAAHNLRAVGAMNKEMLDLVFETDAPDKVLYELGSDPDRAAAIVAMPPAKRALEIAKMAVGVPKKATPTPLSKAPRPVTPIDGSARVTSAPSDADDDATFFAKREAELKAAGRW